LILELDLGNTRCKWRVRAADGTVVARGFGEISQWLKGQFPELWSKSISRIRVASVLSDTVEQTLTAELTAHLQLPPEWARSTQKCAGVLNAYTEPGRLGVDRWLGLIAAYQHHLGSTLVISVGSALTIDLIDRAGLHRGGYIIPGPRLMSDALLHATDRVRFEQNEQLAGVDFGRDTASCVHNGIGIAATGAVLLARDHAETLLAEPTSALVSGGYAQSLIKNLTALDSREWRWQPELVLDGLGWALP
jgi:type III pantothenate kinase